MHNTLVLQHDRTATSITIPILRNKLTHNTIAYATLINCKIGSKEKDNGHSGGVEGGTHQDSFLSCCAYLNEQILSPSSVLGHPLLHPNTSPCIHRQKGWFPSLAAQKDRKTKESLLHSILSVQHSHSLTHTESNNCSHTHELVVGTLFSILRIKRPF